MKDERLSKQLSYILRHNPMSIGVTLGIGGWADTDKVIDGIKGMTMETLERIVSEDEKKRYSFSPDRSQIRANQGHSVEVDMNFGDAYPEGILYHGTADRFIESITKSGIIHGTRQYVHLSYDKDTAVKVGKRHGNPVILKVDAKRMTDDGYKFYVSENGVWLTEHVPSKYIVK